MQITTDVLAELSRLVITGNQATIVQQLDRKLYIRVDEVLRACGGKWSRRAKAHVFTDAPDALLEAVMLTGEVTTARDIGFFPTPTGLAQQLVAMADVQRGQAALEPSAGTGQIVDALLEAGAIVTCAERDPTMRAALIANRTPWADIDISVFADADDFLDVEPEPFDRVVMNPPFCRVGRGDHLDHTMHAWEFLATKGVLVAVLPAGVMFREDRRHAAFRAWVAERRGVIKPLPEGSFLASDTGVNTCVLRMVAS